LPELSYPICGSLYALYVRIYFSDQILISDPKMPEHRETDKMREMEVYEIAKYAETLNLPGYVKKGKG